jgi:protein TonB
VEEEEVEEQQIFQVVEEQPEFPGGMGECMKWLAKNMKYPQIAQENGVQGRVIVQFVVNRDGSIVDAVVARGVDPQLDKEALRVVGQMPKWKPGKQRGKEVRVRFTLPVMFRLQ